MCDQRNPQGSEFVSSSSEVLAIVEGLQAALIDLPRPPNCHFSSYLTPSRCSILGGKRMGFGPLPTTQFST